MNRDYLTDLHCIETDLLALDNTAYGTIEEANTCLIKYDQIKDDIISIIEQMIKKGRVKENVYKEAIRLLTNHIGSADDIQKYGTVLESFHKKGKLTAQELQLFYENLNIGRWT
jgi:hypothetical protein